MGESFWNRGASFPISSLSLDELKEAIHEWAEGYEELEKLLWACYNNGIETSGSHVNEYGNYLEFYINNEQAKRLLAATEAYGFGEIFVMFGGNPLSGPNWHKTSFSVSCLKPEDVRNYFVSATRSIESEQIQESYRACEFVADFAKFFEDKMTGVSLRANVRNHSEYEFFIESYMNQRNWAYFDELFGSLGMIRFKQDDKFAKWQLKAYSQEDFYVAMQKVIEGVRNNWSLPVCTEPTEDMGFNLKALIMQKKFGTSPEGVKKMNDWINANNPDPKAPKVNY